MRDAHRLAGNPNEKVAATYAGLTMIQNGRVNWTGKVRELPDRLDQPRRWRRPRRIFVNSMSDLFHEDVSDHFIWRVFTEMRATPRHQFQVLTKRPERMQKLLRDWTNRHAVLMVEMRDFCVQWPPLNVWLGTSVEDQKRADERIPYLQATPAAVRFLSVEPLLEPVDLGTLEGIHWVIVGGESGHRARACKEEWVRSVVEQCRSAGVPCFTKQMGSDWAHTHGAKHSKGGDIDEWPEDLQVREYPR
jgi:protein gp37